jgi:hypothetical protein
MRSDMTRYHNIPIIRSLATTSALACTHERTLAHTSKNWVDTLSAPDNLPYYRQVGPCMGPETVQHKPRPLSAVSPAVLNDIKLSY